MTPSNYAVHLMACSPYRVLSNISSEYGPIDLRYRHRFTISRLMSLVTEPLRESERKHYESEIANQSLTKDPIFVIGHWRSGTTHLTNLLTRDNQFGYVSYQQCFFPYMCINNQALMKPFMKFLLPEKRPMDNMKVDLELPQEEEFAIGARGKSSFYHGFFFPKELGSLFNKYVTFKSANDEEIASWKKDYQEVIKTASYLNKHKQLILKTPMNTARIPELLSLYPNAKFVFISRNPDDVYYSTMKLFSRMIKHYQFQHAQQEDIPKLVRRFYKELMGRYFEHRSLIKPGNLVEITYEELTESPIETMEKIYSDLHIKNFQTSKLAFGRYLKGLDSYKTNTFKKSKGDLELVRAEWQKFYQLLGYR